MPLIEWDASYSVGNPELDAQHRRWLTIINQLHADMAESKAVGTREIVALSAMLNYARQHFMAEERHMREIGFPGTIDHIKVHNECYGRIAAHLHAAESGKAVQTGELLRFLKGWLTEHILCEDQMYCAHAANRPESAERN